MRKNKFLTQDKKPKNIKLFFGIVVLLVIGIGVIFSLINKKQEKGADFKIGILAEDGIAIVSISDTRKMINVLKTDQELQLWIPEGLGWYRSSAIKKILQQEKKVNLFEKILFYNFGFVSDKVVILKKIDDWKNKFWWQYFWNSGRMIFKEEIVKKDIRQNEDWLDEIMMRDFTETKVMNEDVRLSIINTTDRDGLADFMANNLERLGFSVISVSGEIDNQNGCQIIYGPKIEETFSWNLLKKIIDCPKNQNLSLNDGEIEIYFDDKFAEVIKYPSYK